MTTEVEKIVARYARRDGVKTVCDPLDPAVWKVRQEKERALVRWIHESQLAPLSSKRLLEIGCGAGANVLELLRLGFRPENLVGNELLPERAKAARDSLPQTVAILEGNALDLSITAGSFDVVFQSTVFTSILDPKFQDKLARCMWEWVTPGGGVLWYDFIYDNPVNSDVRGVPLGRVRQLFPHGRMRCWRVTLAPPINRIVTHIHPVLYSVLNAIPVLRTHVLCWIQKD